MLQTAKADLLYNDSLTKQLLKNVKAVNGKEDLGALKIGCDYVAGFVLPLALELSLKSLILKGKIQPKGTHNLVTLFNSLSNTVKNSLSKKYCEITDLDYQNNKLAFKKLLESHKNDFEGWRYLDEAEKITNEFIKLQYAICTVLDIYSE